jgi:class 3 adenylate cyclase
VAARTERKVVTCLFCDLVGFTSQAEAMDPEDVDALLSGYHEQVRSELERHGGTVEKFVGDAVMALFGAPTAHEDDPERAVRAALAIRDGLTVRIGITTGEALVRLDSQPGDAMATGDVVNTASRLQSAAPESGILVDETTCRATQRAIEYREAKPVEAKGKTEPVPVWEAVEARSRLEVDVRRPRAPLVGRRRELDVLVDALARAREERSPQLVTLVGEPGIGKSRLVYELFQRVEADPALIGWRHGRSLPYGEGVTFWALGEMVKTQAGILETDPPEAAEEKLRAAVEGMDDVDWIARHLRPLAGLEAEIELGADRSEAFAAWGRFFEELAERRPLVLVFEDLHWADEGLLDFVDHLVDWASGVPILVVGSARPELLERRPGWGGGKRNATTISLSPLTDEDAARLLAALLDRAVLPADTQSSLLQRAGGNPLYAEEFARMLAEQGAADELPETLQGLIAARLDGLAPQEKALLQQAAVVGKVFWLGAVEAMDGASRRELESRLHGLERKEFVRRERRSSVEGDTEYAFLHVLVRDVAYGQIPRAERAEKHERAARWIETLGRTEDAAEMLAHHYLQALDYARASRQPTEAIEAAARRALADAGDRAFALHANEAARRYYDAALDLWPPDDRERNRLLVRRAHADFFLRASESVEALEQTRAELAAFGDSTATAEVAALLSWASWTRGEHDRAVDVLREAAAELEGAPASRAKAVVLSELARVTTMAGDPDAVTAARDALGAAREAGARDVEARALNTLGVGRINHGDPEGLEDLERSLVLAQEISSPMDVSRAYVNLTSVTFDLGDVERSFASYRAGVEAAERWGMGGPARWLRAEGSEYEYHAGRWDEALERMDEFITEVDAGSPHYLEGPVRSRRSLLRLAQGDVSGALEDDVRQVHLSRDLGDPQLVQPSLAVSAFVRLQAGDHGEALSRIDELDAIWRETPRIIRFNPSELAFAAAGLGRADEFLAAVAAARSTRWLEAASAFASGEYVRAAELFREIGSLPNEAYALLTAGGHAEVQRALDFYRRVGATHYIGQAEARLAATA